MNIGDLIIFVFVLSVCLAALIISVFQFKEKGFLFNNTYLYASKKERETMDKKPQYRQSAIVFLLVGIAFMLLAIEIFFALKWLYPVVMLIVICMIIYAIVSSINVVAVEKKVMLLLAICLTINVFFYSSYNIYELSDKATVIETGAISKNYVVNGEGDNTIYFQSSFLYNNSNNKIITKNLYTITMIAGILKGISLPLILIIVFLFYFLTFFILLPDGWTLIHQKVRLDN